MVKSHAMFGRTLIISPVLFLLLVTNVSGLHAQASGEEFTSPVEPATISRIMTELTSSGEYMYVKEDYEDPQWLQWFRTRIREFFEGWRPDNEASSGIGIITFVIIMLLAVGIMAGAFLFERAIGGRRRYGAENNGGSIPDYENPGGWGEDAARMATDLASSGRLRDAISVLFKSSLRGLDNSGWIRYRQSTASRAYLRQLRRSDTLYPIFRDLLSRFEVAFYRNDVTDEGDWEYLLNKYRNLSQTAEAAGPGPIISRT